MKKLLLSFLFFAMVHAAMATAIVIVVTPEFILLGTDSKRQLMNANATIRGEQQVCKIQSAGTYCFALAGFTSSSATHFSAEQIVSRHLRQAGNYNKALKAIKSELQAALNKELRYQQQRQPAAFAQLAPSKEPLLELVVLSMHQGAPQMEIIGFEAAPGANITVGSYTARCPGDCPSGSQQLYFMGSYRTMEQYLERQQPISEPAELVEKLILEQAKSTPTSVGAPVHLIKYSASGVEWIK